MRNLSIAAAILALFASSAHAQTAAKPAWYLGAGIGYAKVTQMPDESVSLVVPTATSSNFTFDGTNTSAKASLGFNLNRYLALEGSYVNFGKFGGRRDVLAPFSGTVNSDWKVYGFGLAVRAALPVTEKFAVYGKVGGARLTTDYKFNETIIGSESSEKSNRWSLFYGLGMEYDITSRFGLRAEWELYKNATNRNTTNIGGAAWEYNTFFASAYVRF